VIRRSSFKPCCAAIPTYRHVPDAAVSASAETSARYPVAEHFGPDGSRFRLAPRSPTRSRAVSLQGSGHGPRSEPALQLAVAARRLGEAARFDSTRTRFRHQRIRQSTTCRCRLTPNGVELERHLACHHRMREVYSEPCSRVGITTSTIGFGWFSFFPKGSSSCSARARHAQKKQQATAR